MHAQFMAWDTFSRRRIDLVGRQDDGDRVIAHEFDFSTSSSTPAMVSTSHPPQLVIIELRGQWHCAWIGMVYLSHIQVFLISHQCHLQASIKLALSHCLVPANKPITAYAYKQLVMQLHG